MSDSDSMVYMEMGVTNVAVAAHCKSKCFPASVTGPSPVVPDHRLLIYRPAGNLPLCLSLTWDLAGYLSCHLNLYSPVVQNC